MAIAPSFDSKFPTSLDNPKKLSSSFFDLSTNRLLSDPEVKSYIIST